RRAPQGERPRRNVTQASLMRRETDPATSVVPNALPPGPTRSRREQRGARGPEGASAGSNEEPAVPKERPPGAARSPRSRRSVRREQRGARGPEGASVGSNEEPVVPKERPAGATRSRRSGARRVLALATVAVGRRWSLSPVGGAHASSRRL